MRTVHKVKELRTILQSYRAQGKRIGLVPTMGNLHDGHLSLVTKALDAADVVVTSIFVNPAQFGPNEDYGTYPRALEQDLELCRDIGESAVFTPDAAAMYPAGFQTYVELEKLPNHLCGLSRPVFFKGMATVVAKLFNIVKPHISLFGEKDFQQLAVIRRMTKDLNMGVEIIGHPIVREADGLAMSSRNTYLEAAQRESACSLYRAIALARTMAADGERDTARLTVALQGFILSFPDTAINYISFVHQLTLQQMAEVDEDTVLALAVKIGGKVRLIDNGYVAT